MLTTQFSAVEFFAANSLSNELKHFKKLFQTPCTSVHSVLVVKENAMGQGKAALNCLMNMEGN